MNDHQDLAIRALDAMRGDDLARARRAFTGFTPQEMQKPHGESGQTRAEILASYEAHDARILAAIAWVRSRTVSA